MFRQAGAIQDTGRRNRNPVAVDEGVQPVGRGATGRAEEVIESAVDGAVGFEEPGDQVVAVEGDAYLVPYVEDDKEIFLKTVIPSRKATKRYLGDNK